MYTEEVDGNLHALQEPLTQYCPRYWLLTDRMSRDVLAKKCYVTETLAKAMHFNHSQVDVYAAPACWGKLHAGCETRKPHGFT